MNTPLSSYSIGTPITFASLTMVPLLAPGTSEATYDTLDGALAAGSVSVTEVSDAGRVPEIRVVNTGARPVLIIDGEELVGAKQNRTVNISILVPAAADVLVPVTCVEAGRWRHSSRRFSSSSRVHFAAGRAAKSRQVSESLRSEGRARADQGEVWDAIREKSQRMQVRSATSAMSDIFEDHAVSVDAYARALAQVEGQVGAGFLIDGEPRGLDLFAHPSTCRALLPKIVRGYALDAIERHAARNPGAAPWDVDALRVKAVALADKTLRSPREQFPSIGGGETWRLAGDQVSGGLLTERGELLHLSAFPA
jgi:hypothetical protein